MKFSPLRLFAYAALTVLLITAAFGLRRQSINVDFVAFVCGGQAVRERASPYVMQPLYACEQRRLTDLGRPDLTSVVTPSPLPVYALLPFSALSLLPTKIALALWDLIIVASIGLTVYLLRSITQMAIPTIVAAIFIGGIYISLELGQLVPLILAAMVTTAWAVKREHDVLASIAAAVTMFEPNVGLPVCLTLFCIRPKTRLPLIGVGVLFAAVSALAAPISQTMEYFRQTLPAHASSEIRNDEQLSLTHVLSLAGASDRIALLAGSVSYLIALVAGTVFAVFMAKQKSLQYLSVIVAASISTLGGTYLHVQQFTIVSILALCVASILPRSPKACYALLLVSLPLIAARPMTDAIMFTCIAAIIAADIFRDDLGKVLTCTGLAFLATSMAYLIRKHYRETAAQMQHMRADVARATHHAVIPEDVWRVFINEHVFTLLGWNAIAFDVPLIIGTVLAIAASYDCMKQTNAGGSDALVSQKYKAIN